MLIFLDEHDTPMQEAYLHDSMLVEQGISKKQIRHYGFAFEGKKVLIGSDEKMRKEYKET